MDTPLVSALNSKGYSWSPQGKDRDGDGNVTREEFKLPVMEGFGAIVPADLRAGGSMDDAFDSYDLNRDGKIDQREIASSPVSKRHAADRFSNNWPRGPDDTAGALLFQRRQRRQREAPRAMGLQGLID